MCLIKCSGWLLGCYAFAKVFWVVSRVLLCIYEGVLGFYCVGEVLCIASRALLFA